MRKHLLLWLAACLLLAFVLVAYPIYVIRPFRYQGPRELQAAMMVTRYRSVCEIVLSMIALAILLAGWRFTSNWRRVGLSLLALLVIACGILSRVNVYEQMFHPLAQPSFSSAASSKLNAAEQVIAIQVGNAARAYPIRIMSYHHIVNDMLNGRAVVATY